MSECASTIAIADELLSHLDARSEPDGRLAFRGSSLLTGYVTEDGLIDPKVDGWFVSEDFGDVAGRALRVRGRADDLVKIGGESVDLRRLERIAAEIARARNADATVLAVADGRLGHVIHLVATDESIAAEFDAQVLPFERARRVHHIRVIPRSPLGKVLRMQILAELADEVRSSE